MAKFSKRQRQRPPAPRKPIVVESVNWRGNLTKFNISQKELDQFNRLEMLAKRKREKMLRRLTPDVDPGVQSDIDAKRLNFSAIRFIPRAEVSLDKFKTRDAFKKHIERRYQELDQHHYSKLTRLYKDNFMKAGAINYGDYMYEEVELHDGTKTTFYNYIKGLSSDELQYLLVQDPTNFSIDYIYFDDGSGIMARIESLLNYAHKNKDKAKNYNR